MRFRHFLPILVLSALFASGCRDKGGSETEVLEIFHTSDVHGNILTEDLVNGGDAAGGLSRVSSIVASYRKSGSEVLLLDGGDLLQGEPSVYYYNYVDTLSKHFAAQVLTFMQYDAMTVGNHDFETGHSVYDRFSRETSFPLLAANAVSDTVSHTPYFKPYAFIRKGGRKIAVLGLTTPSLVHNLPPYLISGIYFEDQIATAKRLLPEILEQEPDLFIALIHSGSGNPDEKSDSLAANVGYDLARAVPEIDLILSGHDHRANVDSVTHEDGTKTYLLNPGGGGLFLSHATVTFATKDGHTAVSLKPELLNLGEYTADPSFVQNFTPQLNAVKRYVSEPVGELTAPLDSRGALFGPNTFIDLIQQSQLSVFPEADVSMTAPLSDEVSVPAGKVLRKDLFKLYRYENMLYLMRLKGSEIKNYLEESYGRYFHTMSSASDPMLIIDERKRGGVYLPLAEPIFNFDTAAGLDYVVDLSRPRGERVHISTVIKADTVRTFSPDSDYLVVLNSYRGSGGGGLLTSETGAGIPPDSLPGRLVRAEYKDMRRFVGDFLSTHNPYEPRIISSWRLIPDVWTRPAVLRDSKALYDLQDTNGKKK